MTPEHKEHLARTALIGAMFLIAMICLVVLYVVDSAPDFRVRLEGMLVVLLPAVIDSARVFKKQKVVRDTLRPPAMEGDEE